MAASGTSACTNAIKPVDGVSSSAVIACAAARSDPMVPGAPEPVLSLSKVADRLELALYTLNHRVAQKDGEKEAAVKAAPPANGQAPQADRKRTRLNSSHLGIS